MLINNYHGFKFNFFLIFLTKTYEEPCITFLSYLTKRKLFYHLKFKKNNNKNLKFYFSINSSTRVK